MSVPFRFVAGAWNFYRRQPALRTASFVLVFLPLLAGNALDASAFGTDDPSAIAVVVVLQLCVAALATWGVACVLTVGKRMLQAKSGRLRTSFKAVQGKARGLVATLLLTEILRCCIALLWALPLLLACLAAALSMDEAELLRPWLFARAHPWFPALAAALALLPAAYLLRTVLSPLVVAYEKIGFREALNRSKALTTPRLGRTLSVIVVLAAVLWAPGVAADLAIATYAEPVAASVAGPLAKAALDTLAAVLWLLSLTQLYKVLGGTTKTTDTDE